MNSIKHLFSASLCFLSFWGLVACSASQTNGFQNLVENQLKDEKNYSIILSDMDISEDGEVYKHKYTVVKDKNGKIEKSEMNFVEVPKDFFVEKVDDLGMEIATMDNGTLHRTSSPAGYARHVGDERYGRWVENENGEKVWVFNQQYSYMPGHYGIFWPIFFMDFNTYKNKHRYKSSYYGSSYGSTRMYGTHSTWHQTATKNGFKTKVNGFVSRSTGYSSLKTAVATGRIGNSSASGFRGSVNDKVSRSTTSSSANSRISRSGSGYSGSNSFSRSRSTSGGGK